MPEISAFCPGCGRSVNPAGEEELRPEIKSTGARDGILAALAYVAVVPAIVLLIVPALKDSRFVRFHAWQSIFFAVTSGIVAIALRLLFFVFSIIPFVGFLLAWLSVGLVFMAVVVLWGVLVVKAALSEAYELPWIGALAAQLASKESLF